MYRFHYQVMKPLFNNMIEVCFTDTDSLLYKIYKPCIEVDLSTIAICMDFSNYDPVHKLFSEINKHIPGRYL